MKLGVIIQARLGSSRLPGKILKDFYNGDCILGIQTRRIKNLVSNNVVIATTLSEADDRIVDFANDNQITVYRGSENDVLDRFIKCAQSFDFTHIIRVCSDNPFLNIAALQKLLHETEQNPEFDYIAYQIDGKPTILTHFGFWAEAASVAALKKIVSLTDEKFYHEHVTNYLYSHPEVFKLKFLTLENYWTGKKNLRFTVDTEEDFKNMAYLYGIVKDNDDLKSLIENVEQIPWLVTSMQEQIIQNTK